MYNGTTGGETLFNDTRAPVIGYLWLIGSRFSLSLSRSEPDPDGPDESPTEPA